MARRGQTSLFISACISAIACAAAVSARADDLSQRDRFFAQLSAPMTSIVDGKSFRDGIRRIAEQAEVNLWIDRAVDPTAPIVAAGPVGPTVFAAIEKLADQRQCAVMPIGNVVLVGRPQWVDQTAASILQLDNPGRQPAAEVVWGDLVTPAEALRQACGDQLTLSSDSTLPHDLWPATSWKQIDRRVAATLVLAQFGLKPQFTASSSTFRPAAANAAGRFKRRYSQGKGDNAIRQSLRESDRNSQFRTRKGWIEATASVAAHRSAAAAMFQQFADAPGPDPDLDTFTLSRLSTSAENALVQLARTARRKCVIEPAAKQRCQQMITVEGVDLTLRMLVDKVAEQAGVVAEWRRDVIVVTAKEKMD